MKRASASTAVRLEKGEGVMKRARGAAAHKFVPCFDDKRRSTFFVVFLIQHTPPRLAPHARGGRRRVARARSRPAARAGAARGCRAPTPRACDVFIQLTRSHCTTCARPTEGLQALNP